MARSRNIKPGFFLNVKLAEIDPLGRLLFEGLWCEADREGRLVDCPKRIKATVLPYDKCNVDALLDALALKGFILRYEVKGERYIQIVNWRKHQQPHIKETASELPAPDGPDVQDVQAPAGLDLHPNSTVQEPVKHGVSTVQESLNPLTLNLNPLTLNPLPNHEPESDSGEQAAPATQAAPGAGSVSVVLDFSGFFDRFWTGYPARHGKKVGKNGTRVALRKVPARNWGPLLRAVGHYAASTSATRGYARDPARFLEDDYWREWLEPEHEKEESNVSVNIHNLSNGKQNGADKPSGLQVSAAKGDKFAEQLRQRQDALARRKQASGGAGAA